jgi:hypothetical protein
MLQDRIATLPETMGQLYSLDFLSLVANPIEEIPKSLIQLSQLKDVRTDKRLKIPQELVETRVSPSHFQGFSLSQLVERKDDTPVPYGCYCSLGS